MQNVSTNVLPRHDLDGVFAERQGSSTEGALAVAPLLFTPSNDVRFTHWDEQWVLDTDGVRNAFAEKGYKGDPSTGQLKMNTAEGRVGIYRYGDEVITDEQAAEHAARGVDIVDEFITKYAMLARQHHAAALGMFLSNATNYKSDHVNDSAPDVTDPSSPLIAAVNGLIEKLDDAGVDIDGLQGYAVYNRPVRRYLSQHNEVAEYGSLAVKSDNTEQRRTGYADRNAVANFWQNAFEVPLTAWTCSARVRTSGTVAAAMSDDISIVFVDPGAMGGGFVRTATKSAEKALGMITEYVPPKIGGRGFYVEQAYGFIRPDGDDANAGAFGALLDGVTG